MSHLIEMEAFLAVVEEGSFTAAGRRLGVTKSYASKLVGRLEDRLGVRLLQRTTRQLTLTEAGRAYFERCSDAMRALSEAEAAATELQTSPQGRLRINLPTAFAVRYLAAPLAEFKARYPELTVEAILADRKVDILAEGAGRLQRVLPDWRFPLSVSAVFPNARHVPAKVRILVDFLVAHFQRPPWADCA
jgi:DNA-binding transcriptional LysR family regulator